MKEQWDDDGSARPHRPETQQHRNQPRNEDLEGADVLNTAGPKSWTQIWSEAVSAQRRMRSSSSSSQSCWSHSLLRGNWRTKTQKSAETLQILFTIKQKKVFRSFMFHVDIKHISCWTQNNLRFRSFGYDAISRWRVKVCSHQAAALCISLTSRPLRHFVMYDV